MHIAFVSIHPPESISNWSGLNYFILRTLREQGFTCITISGLSAKPNLLMKLKYRLYLFFGKKTMHYDRTRTYAKQYAKKVLALLPKDIDLIFTLNSMVLPYLKTNIPIVLYTDATLKQMINYYPYFTGMPAESKRMALALEKRVFQKCTCLLFASDWAANSASEDYGIKKHKIHVVPFGANIIHPLSKEKVISNIQNKDLNEIEFLFVGVDFERKGGFLAIEIVKELNILGIKSKLTIVGIEHLNIPNLPGFVNNIGFLNKSKEEDVNRLHEIFLQSHFFLMPSQRECYGVVFIEANSYGLPCITTNISGIPTIIKNDVNGFAFDLQSRVQTYVGKIKEYIKDKEAYRELAISSHREYEDRLNWQISGNKIRSIIMAKNAN